MKHPSQEHGDGVISADRGAILETGVNSRNSRPVIPYRGNLLSFVEEGNKEGTKLFY